MNEEPNDDHVANLIRLAGPRARVSEERAARVRENVRDEWLRATRRTTRVRMLSIAAAIAVVILGGGIVYRMNTSATIEPIVRIVSTGNELREIDWRGVSLRLAASTEIRFVDDAVILERGTLYFDGDHAHREIRTRFGVIRDVGTQYEVRVGDTLRIRVREGSVDYRGQSIHAGTELVERNHIIERRTIARNDDDWAWVEKAAPPLRLEGMTLRDALARVAREKGLALGDVPNGDVRLHGNTPLSPSEVLDAATAAAGVTYRIRGEQLIIVRR